VNGEKITNEPGKIIVPDFSRLMDNFTELKCSEFGTAIIENM
jgi:isocitrate dehydrogenase